MRSIGTLFISKIFFNRITFSSASKSKGNRFSKMYMSKKSRAREENVALHTISRYIGICWQIALTFSNTSIRGVYTKIVNPSSLSLFLAVFELAYVYLKNLFTIFPNDSCIPTQKFQIIGILVIQVCLNNLKIYPIPSPACLQMLRENIWVSQQISCRKPRSRFLEKCRLGQPLFLLPLSAIGPS